MDVRRIRPLVPPPYPRRNRYTPMSSGQTALTPLPSPNFRLPDEIFVSLRCPSSFESNPLRWALIRGRNRFLANCTHSASVAKLPFARRNLRIASLPLLFQSANAALVCESSQRTFGDHPFADVIRGILLFRIVTHLKGEVCYNSVNFHQVFANLTISFTGITLASTR